MPNGAPFELPLKAGPGETSIIDANGDVFAYVTPVGIHAETECRSHFILCVNAYPKLVAIVKKYRAGVVISQELCKTDGYDVLALSFDDDIREIDEALADPAFDPNRAVMDAVAGRAAKDAGIEVVDG